VTALTAATMISEGMDADVVTEVPVTHLPLLTHAAP
jgi:hypothetical protein